MSYTIFDSILDCNDNVNDLEHIILFCKQRIKELKKHEIKFISFKAECPKCGVLNKFTLSNDEIDNNFHMTCDKCEKESPIDTYKRRN